MHLDLKDHVTRFTFFALNLQDEIRTAPEDIDAHECRSLCLELLRAFDRSEEMQETYQLAKYALTAWIDDVLCRARWPYAAAWRNYPLEEELFGTRCRHWKFFEQAEVARQKQDWDALRIFQFCVEFGFRGIYAKDRMRVRLNDRLPMARARSETPAPVLAAARGDERLGRSVHFADGSEASDSRGPRSSSFSASGRTEPLLPPTLAEWTRRTFRDLKPSSPAGLPRRRLFGTAFSVKNLADWAIVMAVGLLLFAVLFAMGH